MKCNGTVLSVQKLTSKAGKPYCMVTCQDDEGQPFRLFGTHGCEELQPGDPCVIKTTPDKFLNGQTRCYPVFEEMA